jgi:hypothetical protein
MISLLMAGQYPDTMGYNIRHAVQLEEGFWEDMENMLQSIFPIV